MKWCNIPIFRSPIFMSAIGPKYAEGYCTCQQNKSKWCRAELQNDENKSKPKLVTAIGKGQTAVLTLSKWEDREVETLKRDITSKLTCHAGINFQTRIQLQTLNKGDTYACSHLNARFVSNGPTRIPELWEHTCVRADASGICLSSWSLRWRKEGEDIVDVSTAYSMASPTNTAARRLELERKSKGGLIDKKFLVVLFLLFP